MPDYVKNTKTQAKKKKAAKPGPLGNGMAEQARKKLKGRDSKLKKQLRDAGA